MSENDQHLISDHKEVLDIIRNFDKIILISTSGDPVNEYTLEYKIKGYTLTPNGTPTIARRHQIKISLPFGYPHFHPLVNPISNIFHPDFDENVVSIAHFWETNHSLAKLVVHLGEMISGSCSNTENPFNDEATRFYRDNAEKFPLDTIANEPKPKPKPPAPTPTPTPTPVSIPIPTPTPAPVVRDSPGGGFNIFGFLLKLTTALLIIALIAFGVIYFKDRSKLKTVESMTIDAETDAQNLFYSDAEKQANEALSHLQGILLLKKAQTQAQARLETLLNSQEMQEGLQGKIEFNGKFLDIDTVHQLELLKELEETARNQEEKGNTDDAIHSYEQALSYAQKHNITQGIKGIQKNLVTLKLEELFSVAEEADQANNRENAIHAYQQIVEFIKQKSTFVTNADKQLAKARLLLIERQISLYSQKASEAEQSNDLQTAIKQYDTLIDLIKHAGIKKTPAMEKAWHKSWNKKTALSKEIRIETLNDWLLGHYTIFFQVYYPMVNPKALKSPKAQFEGYNDDESILFFSINCLDTSSGSVVRLHMNLKYILETKDWKVIQDAQ